MSRGISLARGFTSHSWPGRMIVPPLGNGSRKVGFLLLVLIVLGRVGLFLLRP
jgi:hypothetical protein